MQDYQLDNLETGSSTLYFSKGLQCLPSVLSGSFPLLLVVPVLTVSDEVLSLVLGSRFGFGGGCFRELLLSSSVPPTE